MMYNKSKYAILIKFLSIGSILLSHSQKVEACSCSLKRTIEQEYFYSELVVKGRMIGYDTVSILNDIYFDKKGIKVGREKYAIHRQEFIKITLVVDINFKSRYTVPDTIYVLTSSGSSSCGFPFPPYFSYANIPIQFYEFVIYGDRWIEKSITTFKKGNKSRSVINEIPSDNTFETSICRRTQSANDEEITQLTKLRK